MSEADPPVGRVAPEGADEALARDWITVWQSELAALAADREAGETWQQTLALWAGLAACVLGGADAAGAHPAGADAASRPAPAAAAPDARDAAIDRLARRIGELERRLADLEGRRG
jgi:hypothetical protein